MNFKDEIKIIKEKLKKLDKLAQNPFLDSDFSTNPFKDAFSQVYVWIDKDEEQAP